jgi:hypothetical protein
MTLITGLRINADRPGCDGIRQHPAIIAARGRRAARNTELWLLPERHLGDGAGGACCCGLLENQGGLFLRTTKPSTAIAPLPA